MNEYKPSDLEALNVNRHHRCIALSLIVGMLLIAQTGCVTAAKTAYYEIRGAKVKVVPARTDVPRTQITDIFAPYQSFSFQPATTTLGSHLCPPKVISAYNEAARALPSDPEVMAEFPGGGSTLTISSDIEFFESKGLLGSALMFTRVHFRDGGRDVLDALVITKSSSFREGGRTALATETVEGIGDFLRTAKTGEEELDSILP